MLGILSTVDEFFAGLLELRRVKGIIAILLSLGSGAVLSAQMIGHTAVVSRVYNSYARTTADDGSYQPESYVFADGGIVDEEPIANDSMNRIGFDEVARLVAAALRTQNYVPSSDSDATQLLIVLRYGNTRRTLHKPAAYELIESRNARILGFQRERARADALSFTSSARDFYDEFQAGRYFVVLKVYDFQVARQEKRLKLLWESRFSISRQGEDFRTELPKMAEFAARTFGQETNGIFDPDSVRTEVTFGEAQVVAEETSGEGVSTEK